MAQNWREHRPAIIVALVLAIATATGAPWWWRPVSGAFASGGNGSSLPPATALPPTYPGVIGFRGGCAPFQVYAQDRWAPYGTAVRTEPSVLAHQISGYAANYSISVDGWVHASAPYKTNIPPFNSDIWFHVADGSGWVSFAGVRAVPTSPDPTLRSSDGGTPARTPAECQGSAQ